MPGWSQPSPPPSKTVRPGAWWAAAARLGVARLPPPAAGTADAASVQAPHMAFRRRRHLRAVGDLGARPRRLWTHAIGGGGRRNCQRRRWTHRPRTCAANPPPPYPPRKPRPTAFPAAASTHADKHVHTWRRSSNTPSSHASPACGDRKRSSCCEDELVRCLVWADVMLALRTAPSPPRLEGSYGRGRDHALTRCCSSRKRSQKVLHVESTCALAIDRMHGWSLRPTGGYGTTEPISQTWF